MVRVVYLVGRPCTSPLCPAIWQCSPPPPRAPPAGAVMPVATRRPGWLRVGRFATPSFCPPGASGGGGGSVGGWRADQRIGGDEDVGRGRRRQRWWLLSTLATATAGLAGAGGWPGGGEGVTGGFLTLVKLRVQWLGPHLPPPSLLLLCWSGLVFEGASGWITVRRSRKWTLSAGMGGVTKTLVVGLPSSHSHVTGRCGV